MANTRDQQSPLEEGRRNTQIRRDTDVRGSMGVPASGSDTEKVTPDTDVFEDEDQAEREPGSTRDKA